MDIVAERARDAAAAPAVAVAAPVDAHTVHVGTQLVVGLVLAFEGNGALRVEELVAALTVRHGVVVAGLAGDRFVEGTLLHEAVGVAAARIEAGLVAEVDRAVPRRCAYGRGLREADAGDADGHGKGRNGPENNLLEHAVEFSCAVSPQGRRFVDIHHSSRIYAVLISNCWIWTVALLLLRPCYLRVNPASR